MTDEVASSDAEEAEGAVAGRALLESFLRFGFARRASALGCDGFFKPVFLKELAQINGTLEIELFHKERVRAKFVGSVYVPKLAGRGENNDRQTPKVGLVADP